MVEETKHEMNNGQKYVADDKGMNFGEIPVRFLIKLPLLFIPFFKGKRVVSHRQ